MRTTLVELRDDAAEAEHLPDSLLIVGDGYVSLEQAQLLARLGARVTMLAEAQFASE
ncbi:FAD-dependent oxidoreductase [Georgenia daeguensis]|uniref:FAD/NAD(P)-binding domain-containing protein n=1 Tax=Georgenia daeguensis TaxID=908355 RepID=A0ABP8EYM4_9MICO